MSGEDQRAPQRTVPGSGMRIGRVLGVPIVVQPLWFVIVIVIALTFAPEVRRRVPSLGETSSYAVSLGFVLLLYGSVLLHEISHVAVAKSLGMQVHRIVLQLLGGLSEIAEERPGSARREYLVAVAGPMSSLFLAAVGYAVRPVFADGSVPRLLADGFALTNLFVAAFNALPGLPLDGGRVLRALLWQVTHDKTRGTLAAGWVGRVLAVAVIGVAVAHPSGFGDSALGAVYLVILAIFIWSNASMAIAQAKVSGVLPRLDIKAMTRRALPVTPDVPVAEAIRRAREAGARALVVVDSTGRPSGLVSEAAVSALPAQRQPWVLVGDVSRPIDPGLVLQLGMDGESLVEAVQTHPATEYLVVDRSEAVVGVLSRIDLVSALQSAGLR